MERFLLGQGVGNGMANKRQPHSQTMKE
jgi:hypothetical protein